MYRYGFNTRRINKRGGSQKTSLILPKQRTSEINSRKKSFSFHAGR
jgi:hypothetical protein